MDSKLPLTHLSIADELHPDFGVSSTMRWIHIHNYTSDHVERIVDAYELHHLTKSEYFLPLLP